MEATPKNIAQKFSKKIWPAGSKRTAPGAKKNPLTPFVDDEWTRLPPSLATECLEAFDLPDTTDVSMSLGGPFSCTGARG